MINPFKLNAILFTSLLITLTFGCSHKKTVVIDPEGVDMGEYQRDLTECQQIAQQVESEAGEGAVGGAVVGGLIGAIAGGDRSMERSAGVGAVIGGAKGAGETRRERELVIKNCMRNRGYKVLN